MHSTTQVVLYLKSGVTNGLAEIYLRHVRRTSLCAEGVVMYSRIQHSKRKKKTVVQRTEGSEALASSREMCVWRSCPESRGRVQRLSASALLAARLSWILECAAALRVLAVRGSRPGPITCMDVQRRSRLLAGGRRRAFATSPRRQRARFSVPLWAEHACAAPTSSC